MVKMRSVTKGDRDKVLVQSDLSRRELLFDIQNACLPPKRCGALDPSLTTNYNTAERLAAMMKLKIAPAPRSEQSLGFRAHALNILASGDDDDPSHDQLTLFSSGKGTPAKNVCICSATTPELSLYRFRHVAPEKLPACKAAVEKRSPELCWI